MEIAERIKHNRHHIQKALAQIDITTGNDLLAILPQKAILISKQILKPIHQIRDLNRHRMRVSNYLFLR